MGKGLKGISTKLVFVNIIAVCLLLVACVGSPGYDLTNQKGIKVLDSAGIIIHEADPAGFQFSLINVSENEYVYGDQFVMYEFIDDSWAPIEWLNNKNSANPEVFDSVLPPKSETEITQQWWDALGEVELKPGIYKIQKKVLFYRNSNKVDEYVIEQGFAIQPDDGPQLTPRGYHGFSIIDNTEDREESTDSKHRQAIEADGYITAKIIGEIDSNKQPPGISPETSIVIEKEGYDIVIRGCIISGSTDLAVFSKANKSLSNLSGVVTTENQSFDAGKENTLRHQQYRIRNAHKGEYRIVVKQFAKNATVNCLLKVYLEMTKPEIDFPYLVAEKQVNVKNPYGALLVVECNNKCTNIDPNSSSMIGLSEGTNTVNYFLKDGDNHSETINSWIIVDTTPPVITLNSTFEKNGKVVFNMSVDEYVDSLKINGEERGLYGGADPDGSCPFAHIAPVGTKSITVEARDLAGNVSKTVVTIDENTPVIK